MIRRKTPEAIDDVASCLRGGGVCILPTDTVYGLSAIAVPGESAAEKRLKHIKGRDDGKPFIRLIADPSDIKLYSDAKIPRWLLEKWPGPVTVVVPVFGGETAAFRCPGDEWLRRVIRRCGAPIFSTSANKSGLPPMTRFSEIKEAFEKDVDLIVFDGDVTAHSPSTIVALEGETWRILRRGDEDISPSGGSSSQPVAP